MSGSPDRLNSRAVFCYAKSVMASNTTARRVNAPVVSVVTTNVSLLISLPLIGVGILMPTFSG
jgi:hypothetical protein